MPKHKDEQEELIRTGRRKPKRPKKQPRVPEPERVRMDFGKAPPRVSRYYIAIADRYRAARYLSILLLVVFLLVMLLFCRKNITYNNLMYLIRDLDAGTVSEVGKYADFDYERQYASSFACFRDRIVVAGSAGLRLYNSNGVKELDYESAYGDPRLCVGEKYALQYDAGGKEYAVYTTVTRVFRGTADEVIEDAAVAENGTYALLTGSNESKYLITVYNPDFKTVARYYKDKYVVDLALDAEGSHMAVASAGTGGSGALCELMFCDVGSEKTKTVEFENTMPLALRFAEDGTLIVLCDNKVLFFKGDTQVGSYAIAGRIPSYFDLSGNTFALVVSKNAVGSENDLLVFDTEGNIIYNSKISEKVRAVAADGDRYVVLLCEERAVQLPLSGGDPREATLEGEVLGLLTVPGGAILCEGDGTRSVFFGE